jgi:hypothetical protein
MDRGDATGIAEFETGSDTTASTYSGQFATNHSSSIMSYLLLWAAESAESEEGRGSSVVGHYDIVWNCKKYIRVRGKMSKTDWQSSMLLYIYT